MVYLLVIIFIFVLDMAIKNCIIDMPETCFPLDKCKGKVRIVKTYNEGMACNIMEKDPELVKKLSSIVLIFFSILCIPLFFSKKAKEARKVGAAMLIGGAASNVVDRHTKGKVVDYIQFNVKEKSRMAKMTYNIADFAVILGAILFAMGKRKKKKKK